METKKKKNKTALWILLAILALLLILGLVYHHAVRQIVCNLLSPTLKMDESATWAGGKAYEKLPYATGSDAQYLDLYVPDSDTPVPLFVLVHGGGFVSNDSQSRQAQWMYRYFRDHGFACASINYRLAAEAPFPAACADVKAAVRYLCHNASEYGFDAERIAIWGESAGGYLATFTALTAPDDYADVLCIGETESTRFPMPAFDALVDFYGILDFPSATPNFTEEGVPAWLVSMANGWLSSSPMEGFSSPEEYWLRKAKADWDSFVTEDASVLYHAKNRENGNPGLRTLIVHGDADITVSHLQSVQLHEILKANGEDVILRLISGCKHADDRLFRDELLKDVSDFIFASFS